KTSCCTHSQTQPSRSATPSSTHLSPTKPSNKLTTSQSSRCNTKATRPLPLGPIHRATTGRWHWSDRPSSSSSTNPCPSRATSSLSAASSTSLLPLTDRVGATKHPQPPQRPREPQDSEWPRSHNCCHDAGRHTEQLGCDEQQTAAHRQRQKSEARDHYTV